MKRALAIFAVILLAASCTHHAENAGSLPVIIVNGDAYKASDFADDIGKKLKNFDALAAKDPTNVKRVKENALKEFIVSSLLSKYAREHQITVTPEEVNAEFERVRKTYPDDLTFKASLASDGMTFEKWRQSLKKTILEKKVFASLDEGDGKDDLDEARKYYSAHKQEFQRPAQIHIQQILVPRQDDADRLLRKIKSGAKFADLAKKYSISPDGKDGGDIGYLSRGTVPAFDSAFTMKPGQISPVIKSTYGFHIIKVLDKRPQGLMPFEQAKPQILRQLKAQRQQNEFDKWLDGAIKSAKVERNDDLIKKIRIQTEGEQE